jgi:DNA-directed RNA polymerase specialized sigma24 family protein
VPAARSLARQLVRNRAEADDVVAETFAKILDLLHRGGGPDDAFRPYLLTAVRRAAYDRHRAERMSVPALTTCQPPGEECPHQVPQLSRRPSLGVTAPPIRGVSTPSDPPGRRRLPHRGWRDC